MANKKKATDERMAPFTVTQTGSARSLVVVVVFFVFVVFVFFYRPASLHQVHGEQILVHAAAMHAADPLAMNDFSPDGAAGDARMARVDAQPALGADISHGPRALSLTLG